MVRDREVHRKVEFETRVVIGKDHNYGVFPIATLDVELDAD